MTTPTPATAGTDVPPVPPDGDRANGFHQASKNAIFSLLRRLSAWLFDWACGMFLMGCILWDEIVLHRVFNIPPAAWTDFNLAWGCELARYGKRDGLSACRASWLEELPSLLDLVARAAFAVLFVSVLRRLLRVTPGEWTFSVRRPPATPPADGIGRGIARVAAGFFAFFAALVLWAIADLAWMNPI